MIEREVIHTPWGAEGKLLARWHDPKGELVGISIAVEARKLRLGVNGRSLDEAVDLPRSQARPPIS